MEGSLEWLHSLTFRAYDGTALEIQYRTGGWASLPVEEDIRAVPRSQDKQVLSLDVTWSGLGGRRLVKIWAGDG